MTRLPRKTKKKEKKEFVLHSKYIDQWMAPPYKLIQSETSLVRYSKATDKFYWKLAL